MPKDQLGIPNSIGNCTQPQARWHPSKPTSKTNTPAHSLPHMAIMYPLTRYPKSQIPSQPHPGATSPKRPHQLSPAHPAPLHSCSDHHARARNRIPPLIFRQDEQLVSLHFRYTVTHTHLISAHLYTLRCLRKASKTHPQHSLENRIEKAYHILHLSTSYPGLPTMPMSVALAKQGNTGIPYTTYLLPLVTAEWARQITSTHPIQQTHATQTGNTQSHFMQWIKQLLRICGPELIRIKSLVNKSFFFAASAAKFWKRHSDVSGASETAFSGGFGHFFGCSTAPKSGVLAHKNSLASCQRCRHSVEPEPRAQTCPFKQSNLSA